MKKVTSVIKGKNVITSIMLFCSLAIINTGGTSAFALDLIGSPVANLQQSQLQSAIEYSQSTMDMELVNGRWKRYVVGEDSEGGSFIDDFKVENFKANKISSYFGYSFTNNLEAFVRLGTTSSEFGDSIYAQSEEFESDGTPTIGGGLKVTLYDDFRLKFGGTVQANWANYEGQLTASDWAAPDFVSINIQEVQVALGASYKWTDHISVYGGPVYHFITGEFDDVFVTKDEDDGDLQIVEYNWDIESNSNFGGYIGTQVDLIRNLCLNFEYKLLGSSDAFGANVIWKY